MKKFISLLILVTIAASILEVNDQMDKQDYKKFIQIHPYHPSKSRGSKLSEGPSQDRPDLAWEQNFLMTMNPKLGRPTPERLIEAKQQINDYFQTASNARTGTEQFPWEERGPAAVGGRTRAIMWDPNDPDSTKVWAGGVSGGLWVNENIYDVASQWEKVDDFWESMGITSITYDPSDPEVLYVGTGESAGGATRGEGVFKSSDGGDSWEQLPSTEEFYFINDLVVRDEDSVSALYVAVTPTFYRGSFHGLNDLGLQRSIDGGQTFTEVLPTVPGGSTPHAIADLEIASNGQIWIGTVSNVYGEGGGYILNSFDGITWEVKTQREPGDRVMISSAPSNPDVLYALVEAGGVVEEVIKTVDGGETWTNLDEPADDDPDIQAEDFSRDQAWYDLIVRVDPNDENAVIVGGIDLFKTSDGGETWDQLSHWYGGFGHQYVHADQHAILYSPKSSSDVLFGNDGGVFLSSTMDQADPVIQARNNHYNVTQFYSCAIHPTQDNYYLAGSQDNGTQQFTQAGLGQTTDIFGGDGAYCFIDQTNGNFQISSYVYNVYGLNKQNGSGSFADFADDQESGRFINPADYDDSLAILYTAVDNGTIGRFYGVRDSINPVRQDFEVDLLGDLASHIKVSPFHSESTTLFVGTGVGNLIKIDSADRSNLIITDLTGNLPEGFISSIDLGASEDQIIVTFSNYGITNVWQSLDGGVTWDAKDGNLPDLPVRWVLYNPNNRLEVIIATELGIWRTVNIEADNPIWEPSNVGLANVRVDMLQIRASDYQVIAATHGRGLYSSYGFTASVVPQSPSDLTAIATTPFEIELEWVDNSDDETGFVLERSTDGQEFEVLAELDPDVVSYTDSNLDDFTSYFYRVKSINNAGDSEYSSVVEQLTPEAKPDFVFTNFFAIQSLAEIDVSGSIQNTGYLDQDEPIDIDVYWSTEEVFDESSVTLYFSTLIASIPLDQTRSFSETVEVLQDFPGGTIYFFGVIDPENQISEDDEENNRSDSSIEFIPLGLDEPFTDIKLYPIPFTNSLTLENRGAEVSYKLFDVTGRFLMDGKVESGKKLLPLSHLSNGIYHMRIYSDQKQKLFKIIKR